MLLQLSPSWAAHLGSELDKPYYRALESFVNEAYASTECYPPRDKIGEAQNGAYANACDKAKCDAIVGAHYKVRIEDYFVFKKLTCEIFGYPAKITGVELIENKSLPCCCDKK